MTEKLGQAHPLARCISDFFTDVANAGASGHTLRAYRGDLAQFAAHHNAEIGDLDAATVRAYLADVVGLAPSTRKRKRAAVASFCRWAVRHDLLPANPIDKIDTIKGRAEAASAHSGQRRRQGAGGDLQPPTP